MVRAAQEIFRVRRQYNKWVCDETLEDYALRFTATKARRWSIDKVAKTALGATAFLALEAIAAAVTLNYGFVNTIWAMMIVGALIFITGAPIVYYAAKYGLDIDLLTRSAGFGYLGSTLTSLIYASFTFLFFAIEAAILASALEALFGIPPFIGYILCSIAVIPIVTHGISAISKFQIGSQSLWLVLQILAVAGVLFYEIHQVENWMQFTPADKPQGKEFNLALFGGASAIFFAFVAQIGEQVDYLRFMPEKTDENKKSWWFWLMFAGPGWITVGILKMLFGSFLAYLAIMQGEVFNIAADPMHMYQMAYGYLTQSPVVALALAGTMIIISQMKINVTNAYAGSIAWSNFFSRLTHSHPGRVVWLFFNVGIALVLMELGIYRALESILGIFSIVAISWLSCLSADLMINKPLGLSPPQGEFKRAHLYDINPVGIGSMFIASVFAISCYTGLWGDTFKVLSHYIAMASCFVLVPTIAKLTNGKYYLARQSHEYPLSPLKKMECCICQMKFEAPDTSHCPAYQGPICSLCCSLDARCMDACKEPEMKIENQMHTFFALFLPLQILDFIKSRLGIFLSSFSSVGLFVFGLLAFICYHMQPQTEPEKEILYSAFGILFFIVMMVFGVMLWLFLLAHESRKVAQQESNQQTKRLINEIEAHKITDQSLQEAKEIAERASEAKSRYLTGISHELRTPLQSMLGYAQLLVQRKDVSKEQAKGLNIIYRNGEYLTSLIEGLLDISKIEAGRLEIYRNTVNLPDLLDQLFQIFSPEAEAKGVRFEYSRSPSIPDYVFVDEKRLKQILINLLSNAVKFTESGSVSFRVEYKNQVAVFSVQDTGVGIKQEDLGRILNPFQRIYNKKTGHVSGTGLGLTIVKLLVEIMGGDLRIESEPEKGSLFSVSLMLSQASDPTEVHEEPLRAIGYRGKRRKVIVVDDEPLHRGLIYDLLSPLGFIVSTAENAEECLSMLDDVDPDLYLLDLSMPGMDGLTLSKTLRERGIHKPILIISADAQEHHHSNSKDIPHNDYMVKPINNAVLLKKISGLLKIDWNYKDCNDEVDRKNQHYETQKETSITTGHSLLRELKCYTEIGYTKGVNQKLDEIRSSNILDKAQMKLLDSLADRFLYEKMTNLLDTEQDKGGDNAG